MNENWYTYVEDYNLGRLASSKLTQFEAALSADPALAAAVQEHRMLWEAQEMLVSQQLRAQIRQKFAEQPPPPQQHTRRWIWILAALLLCGGTALVLWFNTPAPGVSQQTTTPPPPEIAPQPAPSPATRLPDEPPIKNVDSPAAKPQDNKEPIAQLRSGERLPGPLYPAPEPAMIRGDQGAGKALKTLLDQVWYTHYPLKGLKVNVSFKPADESLKKRDFNVAYLALEQLKTAKPDNDTLRYLKGYCLLEMGEGMEALTYFDAVQGRHVMWDAQLEWYRGLAMLLANRRAEAVAVFKKVVANPRHIYHRQAQKALKLLR